MKPLISIIIPTYNRAHLIGETIVSILNQSYLHWECIIVDDGSTDDTENLVLKYIDTDSRIRFYKKPKHLPKGPSAARNYGFKKSKGDYINWFDSDDVMQPEKLETDLEYITSGDYDFTISQSDFFNHNEKVTNKYWNANLWSDDPLNDFISHAIGWSVNVPLWERSKLELYKLVFDEALITADDYYYHIQAIVKKMKPVIINKTLVSQRQHEQQLNDFRNKAPYKLKVNLYLMRNKAELGLNDITIKRLRRGYYNQMLVLLRHKSIKLAWFYLRNLGNYGFRSRTRIKMYKIFIIGFLYKYFGYGYSYLNYMIFPRHESEL